MIFDLKMLLSVSFAGSLYRALSLDLEAETQLSRKQVYLLKFL